MQKVQLSFARHTLGPLFLMLVTPPMALAIWHVNAHLDGSFLLFWQEIVGKGFFTTVANLWFPYFFGSKIAWSMIGMYAVLQLILMKALPGKRFEGPITPKGNIPVYKDNGIYAYATTVLLFVGCSFGLKLFPASIIYDNFPYLLGALNCFSLLFCLMLYFKGKYAPSSTDSSLSGNFLMDYYWGTELYPRIFGWDVKVFTNCRMGMMSWALIIISYAAAQANMYGITNSMLVGVGLQLVYITKFFYWETGYFRTLDIIHDRAGYYICWGCLVWVPGFYTSPAQFLVNHPHSFTPFVAFGLFALGTAAIFTNYFADNQRQRVRVQGPNCKVWGKKPKLTKVSFTTTQGEKKDTILLASGWWGLSRHFNYIPELTAAFLWCSAGGFTHFMPFFYVVFLAALLGDRLFRDEKRCAAKYGADWDKHCEQVRYKLIPYVF